jgi:glutamate synthase domain-containing protein 3
LSTLGGKTVQTKEKTERCFSIELNSKQQIKNISLTINGQKESTLIEGTIGNLIGATFAEGIILEVIGTHGTLRLDLQAKELMNDRGT